MKTRTLIDDKKERTMRRKKCTHVSPMSQSQTEHTTNPSEHANAELMETDVKFYGYWDLFSFSYYDYCILLPIALQLKQIK